MATSKIRKDPEYEISYKTNRARQGWGTTLSASDFHHGLLLVSRQGAFVVWASSTTNLEVMSLGQYFTKTTNNNIITFSDSSADGTSYTIVRDGSNITITRSSNATMTLFYV